METDSDERIKDSAISDVQVKIHKSIESDASEGIQVLVEREVNETIEIPQPLFNKEDNKGGNNENKNNVGQFNTTDASLEVCSFKPIDCDSLDKTDQDSFSILKFDNMLSFNIKSSENKPWISCIKILPSGNIVMGDFNNSKLHVYNKNHEQQKAVIVPGKPCGIAGLNNDNIVVTFLDKKVLAIVNILSRKIVRNINAGDCCHGIAYNDENIAVNCLEKGLIFMDLSGNIHHKIKEVTGEADLCASGNRNIYCSLYWSHKILCFGKDGDQLFSFSNLTMTCPRGISVDNKGHIFFAEFAKNKIHAINSEGTKSHVILSKKHGINNPLCVMFANGCLYVINNDGESVIIFKLTST